ncbi:transmembrane protein 54 [Struthio camelus]|uniref:transmembrane protein 54 n=1 Tax=Struthio camelus TaxID=8801 RepID=UPI0036041E0E
MPGKRKVKPSEEESGSGVALSCSRLAVPSEPQLKWLVTYLGCQQPQPHCIMSHQGIPSCPVPSHPARTRHLLWGCPQIPIPVLSMGTPQLSCPSHFSGHLDPGSHQRLLLKTGLILIITGHLNFIVGVLIHGAILFRGQPPQDATSLQYLVSNISSVLLVPQTISCGTAAIMLSRYLTPVALLNAPPSLSGLGLSGCARCRGLTPPRSPQSSSLPLWTISFVLTLVEIVFSVCCLLLTFSLLLLSRCCRGTRRKKVTLAPSLSMLREPIPMASGRLQLQQGGGTNKPELD